MSTVSRFTEVHTPNLVFSRIFAQVPDCRQNIEISTCKQSVAATIRGLLLDIDSKFKIWFKLQYFTKF